MGLALALDLGKRGTPVPLLDDHEGAGTGSKAICFSKRSLDEAHRMGAAKPMVKKGVVWNVGRLLSGDEEVFEFNLRPKTGHRHLPFIELRQPYFEKFLADAIVEARAEGAPIETRGRNLIIAIADLDDGVRLTVDTPDGAYEIEADYLVACDGARSPVGEMRALGFDGRVFEGAGQSALLHKQPDDVWRINFQLGWDIDQTAELDKNHIRARGDAILSSQTGTVHEYELVWTSIYMFQCRRMETFRQGRVFFAGESAHQVSPFGTRGANSGMQDAENLAWKLHYVLTDQAPEALLDNYSSERVYGERRTSGILRGPPIF